jgi:hypothetical protein
MVTDFIQTASIVSLDGQSVTLHPKNIVIDVDNKTIHVILQENKGSVYETGWQSAQFILRNQPVNIQGNTLTVTNIKDGAGPVITRARYYSAVTAGGMDTIKVTLSEPIECKTVLDALPSDVFVISSDGQQNNSALTGAIFTASCTSTYTSTLTIAVRNNALVLSNTDSIAFVGEAVAVIDPNGNHPAINNRDVLIESGAINTIIISISTNPFTPGVTKIPTAAFQNYINSIPNLSSTGILIGIKSTTPLKETAPQTYGNGDIYDAVGNIVIANVPIKKSSAGYYSLFWDGTNHNNRYVGYGTYAVILTVKDITDKPTTRLIKIGVKR